MPNSLALAEFSDRELLNMVDRVQDDDGWTWVGELADAIGLDHKHPTRCVASRLGRMRALGTVERDGAKPRYRLTELGELIATGKLRAAQRRAVLNAHPAELVPLMQALGDEFLAADFSHALLMRRSFDATRRQRRFR